ncbi:cyclodeaminase/cyclohydrolase family protein [Marinilactibacillus kalidii]|uniref:cyclodeaminase/cyclohydrolase family protein n=1 Tax=Marinilactibacillus kalidii TaxID=2820274 RepID=UPI001ABE76E1|nr:cyclodeaminase/cyclohydrolase family protein [Marinilactibacillus kalidii]
MTEQSIAEYLKELQSKDGLPGGGSATALIGAMSAALIHMVSEIQSNKKLESEFKERVQTILMEAAEVQAYFEQLKDEDAHAFEPVSKAYAMPKETEEQKSERQQAIETGLHSAVQPPLKMMKTTLKLIELYEKLSTLSIRGSIVNDISVGVLFARTALQSSHLNVLVNTNFMKDETTKKELEGLSNAYLVQGEGKADQLYADSKYYLVHKKWPSVETRSVQ